MLILYIGLSFMTSYRDVKDYVPLRWFNAKDGNFIENRRLLHAVRAMISLKQVYNVDIG